MGLFKNIFKKNKLLNSKKDNAVNVASVEKIENTKQTNHMNALEKLTDKFSNTALQTIQNQINLKSQELLNLKNEITLRKQELNNLENIKEHTIELEEYGFFNRKYKFSDSVQYKEKLQSLRNEQKEAVLKGQASLITTKMTLNNSLSQGETMQKQLIKAAIRGFNGEADALLVKVTPANLESKKQALIRAFEQLNKLYKRNYIVITQKYLNLKIQELELSVEYDLQLQEEKQILREQREKEKEDKKLQAEIASKRKQIEKDRKHFKQMLEHVEKMITTASNEEKEKLNLQISEYQNKLSELDELEEDIDYREGHATAGYVYVISNIGSFGQDVYKIGVTRRLEPLDRIRELGSASVPFQFDVHALIFSEEAFALETELHHKLEKYKVNKVNGRKEYFKVPFSEIKKILDEHRELKIELTENAEAFEYRQSLLQNKV